MPTSKNDAFVYRWWGLLLLCSPFLAGVAGIVHCAVDKRGHGESEEGTRTELGGPVGIVAELQPVRFAGRLIPLPGEESEEEEARVRLLAAYRDAADRPWVGLFDEEGDRPTWKAAGEDFAISGGEVLVVGEPLVTLLQQRDNALIATHPRSTFAGLRGVCGDPGDKARFFLRTAVDRGLFVEGKGAPVAGPAPTWCREAVRAGRCAGADASPGRVAICEAPPVRGLAFTALGQLVAGDRRVVLGTRAGVDGGTVTVAAAVDGQGIPAWSREIPGRPGGDFEQLGLVDLQGGLLFVDDRAGAQLYAIDADTGAQRWSVSRDAEAGRLAVTDNRVYVTPRQPGQVVVLELADGSELSRFGQAPEGEGP